ncbi:hypothetical protein GCM10027515_03940 [Schumannella luteola]|uniref:DNA-binding transcriptional LysR family regulator n=1 Tax=Schumannella luteola TaxID=472059 RepID=A0A852YB98_9MICO|nr:LysR family transcriptional regulator [Schumannella luteola]NYG98471.1 DNA-binding transcriptional LysR family regulator [Schumannella luteola]TPX01303.1 LysR family transcriptional regulator [Schumannella luteola]
MTLEIRAIDAFLAVVARRSFTRAALDTGLSEAVLSRLVRTLEAELAAELLERRGANGVAPTEFGELFAAEAPRVMAAQHRFGELAQRLRAGVVGTVTIGWPGHGLGVLGDELLRAVRRRLPDIDLRTVHPPLDAQLRPLTERQVDVLLVREWMPDPDFAATGPIAVEERLLGVSANSALAGVDVPTCEQLRGMRLVPAGLPVSSACGDAWGAPLREGVHDGAGGGAHAANSAASESAGAELLVPLHPAATVAELFRRVRDEEGVCVVPSGLARRARPGDIRFLRLPEPAPSRASLVWRRDAADAAVLAVVDVLVEVAAAHPELGGCAPTPPAPR